MISLLSGTIVQNENGELVILTPGGVGYKIFGSPNLLLNSTIGKEVTIQTYLVVREDTLDLFGFSDVKEKELFKLFLSVSGVGPKTALHLLALGSISEIKNAIAQEDATYLTKVSGIGKKTAERIVLELKSKLKNENIILNTTSSEVHHNPLLGDAIDGLIALGYSPSEARDAVRKLNTDNKSSEQILKEALQNIK